MNLLCPWCDVETSATNCLKGSDFSPGGIRFLWMLSHGGLVGMSSRAPRPRAVAAPTLTVLVTVRKELHEADAGEAQRPQVY